MSPAGREHLPSPSPLRVPLRVVPGTTQSYFAGLRPETTFIYRPDATWQNFGNAHLKCYWHLHSLASSSPYVDEHVESPPLWT